MYKVKEEIPYKNTLEEPVCVIDFDTKREAHLYWLNSLKTFVSQNVIFDNQQLTHL